jgi:hypothetical protein
MRNLIILFNILLFNLIGNVTISQVVSCVPVKVVSKNTLPFKSGEYLSYLLRYKWGAVNSDIGEANFYLNLINYGNGESYYGAKINGGTLKILEWLFKAKESYESRFSSTNLKPIYFQRDVREGKYTVKNFIDFLPDNKIKAKVQKNNSPAHDTLLIGRECTFDVISLFYFTRSIDLSATPAGKEVGISLVIDGEIYNISYRYIGPEVKRIPQIGPRKTLKFAAKVVAGQFFSGKEELNIWVSDDKNRIPLYFETPVKIGKISGRLNKYANLKFPSDKLNLY